MAVFGRAHHYWISEPKGRTHLQKRCHSVLERRVSDESERCCRLKYVFDRTGIQNQNLHLLSFPLACASKPFSLWWILSICWVPVMYMKHACHVINQPDNPSGQENAHTQTWDEKRSVLDLALVFLLSVGLTPQFSRFRVGVSFFTDRYIRSTDQPKGLLLWKHILIMVTPSHALLNIQLQHLCKFIHRKVLHAKNLRENNFYNKCRRSFNDCIQDWPVPLYWAVVEPTSHMIGRLSGREVCTVCQTLRKKPSFYSCLFAVKGWSTSTRSMPDQISKWQDIRY